MRILKIELIKFINEIKNYYPDHIVNMVITFIIFSGFFLGFNYNNKSYYISFTFWFLASSVISEASEVVSFEKQTGTFNQLLIRTTSLYKILIARTTIYTFISAIKMIVIICIVRLAFGINIYYSNYILYIFIFLFISLLSLGILISSLTIKFTKTASFTSVISYILLFFSGAVFPIEKFPPIIQKLSLYSPLTLSINILKNIMDNNIFDSREILRFIILSLVLFFISSILFHVLYKQIKKSGFNSAY